MTEVTILDAMTDPALFGATFGGPSHAAWRALLGGFYGLVMDNTQAETFTSLTGRTEAPTAPMTKLWLAIGRRGGKSNLVALIAVYEAAFHDHRDRRTAGEWATILLIAADRA